jgi:hypothetical protein
VKMAALTGTGRLADDIYLLAHHELNGRPFLKPRAIGLGLAGGLLAELVLIGAIRVAGDGLAVTDRVRPQDALMRAVHLQVLSERQRHCTRAWLTYLAQTAAEDVARRLEDSGYLVLARPGRPWRAARWVPVDADCAFAPLIRVKTALDPARSPAPESTALAGLAAACGLGPRPWAYGPPGARQQLEERTRQLVPDLRELIGQTQAAVDSAVLSQRI